ncbi:hypothetical protein D3C79_873160 [compost metagenome]
MAASLQHSEGAGEVAVGVGEGVVEGIAHPGLGAEVDHPFEPLPGKQCRHGGAIGEIEALEAKAGQGAEAREARLLQAHLVVVIQVVDADHLMALGTEPLRQVKADEAGGAGDQVFHWGRSRLSPRPMA